ncbi:MAG: histidine kinase [Casimicrobiaceae bacterium]
MSSSFASFESPHRRLAADSPTAQPHGQSRPLSLDTGLRWAVVVAVCMSTQYLFQPFVWKHWPVGDVLVGWGEVVRDRVLVAVTIALAVVVATRIPARRLPARAALLALAIVAGAGIGQVVLLASGSPYARGGLSVALGRATQWTGLALCVSGTYLLWLRDGRARTAARASELSRSTTEGLLVRTQLQLLRLQIEPHFLFNTLATIRRLQETQPEEGTRLLRHLIRYLQSTMPASVRRTALGDELDLVESYLAIIAMRMPGRLAVHLDVPEALRGCECPPLTLATLVENAVKHGITPLPEGGAIAVRARLDGDVLEIAVTDTGVGISAAPTSASGGTGMGLANIRARLRALYGNAATLSITGNVPRGLRAVIRLPIGADAPT